jgi:cell volume regulation protein A
MALTLENILLIGSVLLGISIIAGKTSYQLGVPIFVLCVIIGMLAGSEGFGGIRFEDPRVVRFICIVALNFILFSGGLKTRWEVIKPVFWHGLTLSTVGVFLTALSVGIFVWSLTDFTFYEGLLLGSIVSSIDTAAVFSVMRTKSLGLKKNIRATLELESGSNNTIAYFLTIAFTGLIIENDQQSISIIPLFIRQMFIGCASGFIVGKLGKELINRISLDFAGLYPVLVIALMFFTWAFTDFIGGNGFLAIYLASVYLGNQYLIHKRTIMHVFDGIAWLMQIVLFLILGLLVLPGDIIPVIGLGLLLSAFLIFIARPFGVFASLLPFSVRLRNITYISWTGLRGGVPVVFATYPLLAGADKADIIFSLVFFISLSSILLQGTTLIRIAKWLHVSIPEKAKQRTPPDIELSDSIKTEMVEIELDDDCPVIGKRIVDLGFPRSALITVIKRREEYITPNGSTLLEAKDKLVILAETAESLSLVYTCLQHPEPSTR